MQMLLIIAAVIAIGLLLIWLLKDRYDGFKTIWVQLGVIASGAAPMFTDVMSNLFNWAEAFDWERYLSIQQAGYILMGVGVLGIIVRVFFTSGPVPWRQDVDQLK